jgi:hypothetical protein
MFIDEARHLVRAHAMAQRELLTAWERIRLDFLGGRADGEAMVAARQARWRTQADQALFLQVQEAALGSMDDEGLDQQVQALFMELAACHGEPALRQRQDRLLTGLESRWLERPAPAGGRPMDRRDLEQVLARARLGEERQVAWVALCAPVRAGAAEALEWLRLESMAAQAAGYPSLPEEQGQRLGLSPGAVRVWLDLLSSTLGAGIRRAAGEVLAETASGLGRAADQLDTAALGALYPAGTAGRAGLGEPAFLQALQERDPLELLRDSADLLGLEIEEALARWVTRVPWLPAALEEMVEGPAGYWPVVLLHVSPDWRCACTALTALGRTLGCRAGAVLARRADEEEGPAFPLEALLGETFGAMLARLPGSPDWTERLLEQRHPAAGAWWQRRALLALGEDLLRLEWLIQAPDLSLTEAGELWLVLREQWLALRPREAVQRVAARILGASLRAEWGGSEPGADPELGGRLLDACTAPPAPEGWGEARERLLDLLDPRHLAAESGIA